MGAFGLRQLPSGVCLDETKDQEGSVLVTPGIRFRIPLEQWC